LHRHKKKSSSCPQAVGKKLRPRREEKRKSISIRELYTPILSFNQVFRPLLPARSRQTKQKEARGCPERISRAEKSLKTNYGNFTRKNSFESLNFHEKKEKTFTRKLALSFN
jgi:hypothetical protein